MPSRLKLMPAKLASDSLPNAVGKVLYRKWTRIARWRRKRRWQSPSLTRPEEMADISGVAAERLWPGAADRTWLGSAPLRWPGLHQSAANQARAAAKGRFDLLGTGDTSVARPDGSIRWHEDFRVGAAFPADVLYMDVPICLPQEGTDIKIPWELSRFQHVFPMIWTMPEDGGEVFLRHWRDWMSANPLARGVNWTCTMDVAIRAISWTAALAAWGREWTDQTRRELLAALADHGRFVRDNLEWAVGGRTNHYFSDIVALVVLGTVLSPYPPADRWTKFARRELDREICAQFAPDGFDREGSTTYHRLMVEMALLGVLACRAGGGEPSDAAGARLRKAVEALATLCDATGRAPMIGDNDSSRLFPMAPRADTNMSSAVALGAAVCGLEEMVRVPAPPELALLCGGESLDCYDRAISGPAIRTAQSLPESGFFVLGDDRSRMVIHCGPLSYRTVGGHRHMDQLSLSLAVHGVDLLVDPGTYCYTAWPKWRNLFRQPQTHNTVVVDGRPHCRVYVDTRQSYSIIHEDRPSLERFESTPDGGLFVGRHCGYRYLKGGGIHRREVAFDAERLRWTVTDHLDLSGRHEVSWYFHLAEGVSAIGEGPNWRLSCDGAAAELRWTSPDPPSAKVAPAWVAPAYGVRRPGEALVFTQTGDGALTATFELVAGPAADKEMP